MKKIIIPALILGAVSLYSCKGGAGNDSKVVGKWQGVSIESPTEDSMSKVQEQMYVQQIDGLTTVDADMQKEFKTSNLDSVKSLLKARIADQKKQMDSAKVKQAESLEFTLESNGTAILKNEKENDTMTWYTVNVEGKTLLFIDPVLSKKKGALMAFSVDEAKGDNLKLAVHQSSEMEMYINMKKVK